MLSGSPFRFGLLAATVAVGCGIGSLGAYAQPVPVHRGEVTYLTGGIGADEEDAMKAAASNYNLLISNAERDGEFTAGTDLVIRDAKGREVLSARNTGPLFYAQLPAGRYIVDATYNGVERVRSITVGGRNPADIHLIWPQADNAQFDWRRG